MQRSERQDGAISFALRAMLLAALAVPLPAIVHAQNTVAPRAPATGPGAVPAPAAPNGMTGQTVLLQYRIEVAGAYGLRVDVVLRHEANRYAIDTRVRKEGILATLTSRYRAENSATGRLANGAVLPIAGTGRIEVPDDLRSYRFDYKPDGSYALVDQPPHTPKAGREVSEAQRRGSFDPLTAVAVALLGRADPCTGPISIFDTRKRFDLVPRGSVEQALPRQEGPKPIGAALRCDIGMKRIAGYRGDEKDGPTDKPSRLWLAKFDDSGRFYPARLEVDTGFGQLVVWLENVTSRPQTPEDKAALTR